MKFTVNTKEFQEVLNLVKVIAASSSSSRVSPHYVCLFRAYPQKERLELDFSLNSSFMTYIFQEVKLSGGEDVKEIRSSIDLEILSNLRLTGQNVTFTLQEKQDSKILKFQSGSLKGTLLLANADVEEYVEQVRPKKGKVQLTHSFPKKIFIEGLSAHFYGYHYDEQRARKRPVRVHYDRERLNFISKDKLSLGIISKGYNAPVDEFDHLIVPTSLHAVLSVIPDSWGTQFNIGVTKESWCINFESVSVWFDNITSDKNPEVYSLVTEVEKAACYQIKVPSADFKASLEEVHPFLRNKSLATASDAPSVCLKVTKNGKVSLIVTTVKAPIVTLDLKSAKFEDNIELGVAQVHEVAVDIRFLEEFVNSLRGSVDSHLLAKETSEEDRPFYLKWWPVNGETSPAKGKTVCMGFGDSVYLVSRSKVNSTEKPA